MFGSGFVSMFLPYGETTLPPIETFWVESVSLNQMVIEDETLDYVFVTS